MRKTWLSRAHQLKRSRSLADELVRFVRLPHPRPLQVLLLMDVPFISSGAISRAHYALVRKVETAPSPQVADQYLLDEVDAVRDQLARSTLTLVCRWCLCYPSHPDPGQKQCKEYLIILLYCTTTVHSADIDLDFALHHAITLAESGKTVQDKRIGMYVLCIRHVPQ